jgi:predicted HicB family RNase H-like nuclease
MISYRGYKGSFSFDETKNIFLGKVTNSPDVITFQGKSVIEIKQTFRDAINDHLEFCEKYGKSPEKTFSIE